MQTVVENEAIPRTVTPPRLMRGLEAVPYYIRFFRDPIGCMRDAYRKNGELTILGPVLPHEENRRLNVLSVGPEYNRQVLGDPELFRTTGQTLRGPENSAQRRVRFGLTRMQGAKHKQQRKLVMPPFHKKAVEGYHDLMVKTADTVLSDWRAGTRRGLYREMRNVSLRLASTVLFDPDPRESLKSWKHDRRMVPPEFFFLGLALPVRSSGNALSASAQARRKIGKGNSFHDRSAPEKSRMDRRVFDSHASARRRKPRHD